LGGLPLYLLRLELSQDPGQAGLGLAGRRLEWIDGGEEAACGETEDVTDGQDVRQPELDLTREDSGEVAGAQAELALDVPMGDAGDADGCPQGGGEPAHFFLGVDI